MARGDAIVRTGTLADNAVLCYQPAAGVEAMITEVMPGIGVGAGYFIRTYIYDTIDLGYHLHFPLDTIATRNEAMGQFRHLRLFVTNECYFNMYNSGVSQQVGFCGVQTK